MAKPKTTEAQRRAVANYQDKVDRVNCRFPKGTKARIEATGSSINAFIIDAVEEKLDSLKRDSGKESIVEEDEIPECFR